MVELVARLGIRFDAVGPFDGHRIAGATEVSPHQFQALIWRAACPGPACVIHVVDQRGAMRIQSAESIEHLDVLVDLRGNSVLSKQLRDGSVLAFPGGAVVAPDVDNQGVILIAESFNFGEDATHLMISVLSKSSQHFNQSRTSAINQRS